MTGLVVHEWAESAGGAEKVVDQFLEAFPDSDLQCLWNDAGERFECAELKESWIASTPLRKSKVAALPFMIPTWRHVRFEKDYEWLLVSSHLFAHHVWNDGGRIPKFVYAHTPARYIWDPELDERGNSIPAKLVASILKPIDRRASRSATSIATNSKFTRQRILRTWQRESTVIYPPVDVTELRSRSCWADSVSNMAETSILESLPEHFVLGASRFVPYKRLELAIRAGEASGMDVVLAGSGPDLSRLKEIANAAKVPVHFVISPSDSLLRAVMQNATVYVFGAMEDFGIMPVESMALGTPVLVPSVGGATESTEIAGGGIAVSNFEARELKLAIDEALRLDPNEFGEATEVFSAERFRSEIIDWVSEHPQMRRSNV